MRDYAKWMADSVIARNTDLTSYWAYEFGLTLDGIAEVWKQTQDEKYFKYVKDAMDTFIGEDGSIRGYRVDEYNIDHLNNGKIVLTLYQATKEEKYKKALELLRTQINNHPRTREGVFWHKEIYPEQIWLDGLYMGATFYAKYVNEFGDVAEFDDIAKQFVIAKQHLIDEKTGLLYHAYDDARVQPWANKETGLSAHFWSRSMGWYVMALVDTLEVLPKDNKHRAEMLEIFQNTVDALIKVADKDSHVWYQVLDQGDRKGNYLEASGSSMIAYSILKGVRIGLLREDLKEFGQASFKGLVDEFILETKEGNINLNKICFVAGLGGKDNRDGSFTYYISEPIVANEPKGLGPFILAAAENNLLN
ncbi:glycoside hydrolase family 88/105 protein [Clostridium cellulovorans]|uniref:Glycosyl hydrolase family 88 n=2 Tax=Clostridium cellulovorans TaxID=1493 RepID=D9SP30_CLOC7|nr:glycoside hydrolase family 88 protein [Clostridium cellulovorans]ADL51995.1 glycosyl hydrolase family 88 [Clostridium cellulovorans 743B]BAV13188.1 unsaturated glucuronyl hydrolase [Clostridium cellulovorans]